MDLHERGAGRAPDSSPCDGCGGLTPGHHRKSICGLSRPWSVPLQGFFIAGLPWRASVCMTPRFVPAGREVFYDAEHFFDGLRHNSRYALQTLQAAQEAGATVIILCDTNGGTLPEEIAEGVKQARRALKVEIGIHCHNDCDVAVANTLA